ncbi:MAG: FAD-dependent oxidoreductase, partial [Pleurocapsa sp.]
ELKVNHRILRSRRFLLAMGANYKPDFVDDSIAKNYLSFRDLKSYELHNLPKNIIIVGSKPVALELAQTLSIFGKHITLIVQERRILPQEDRDISILIQAQLEADGIRIQTNSTVSQIKTINNQKWLQAGDRALSADEIIIADYRQPNIAGLNLAGVDVKYDRL